MMNKNERMENLKANGIDTSKYFTVNLPNGLAKNSTITLTINENGEYAIVNTSENNDPILNEIIESGYVRNTKLHRRFVMAQMFSMLNYVSYTGEYSGYNDCLKKMYGYEYTLKMMLEEVRVLSKLEVQDTESFKERSHFFNKTVIIAVMEDYLNKLIEYVDKLPIHKCKGVPYKRIKGKDIFVSDFDKKIYFQIREYISYIRLARNYATIYRVLSNFMNKKNIIKLPYGTPKSKEWIDAYKGAGAFYTLKNLVLFHDCGIITEPYGVVVRKGDAMDYLNRKLDEYQGEYYRMFALMKKVIEDNGINTKTYIKNICEK